MVFADEMDSLLEEKEITQRISTRSSNYLTPDVGGISGNKSSKLLLPDVTTPIAKNVSFGELHEKTYDATELIDQKILPPDYSEKHRCLGKLSILNFLMCIKLN